MKNFQAILISLIIYNFCFSSDIPIDSIVRKPQVTDVSLSMDGKYVAALFTDSCDKEKFLSYNVDSKEKKFISPDSYHDVCDYYWVSNDDVVYYLDKEKRLYYHYLIKINRDLNINSKRLFCHAWGGTHVINGLEYNPDYMMVFKIPRSGRLIFEKMHIQKGTQEYREKFKGSLIQSEVDFNGELRLVNIYNKKNKGYYGKYMYRDSHKDSWVYIDFGESDDVYSFTSNNKNLYVGTYNTTPRNVNFLRYGIPEQVHLGNKQLTVGLRQKKSLYIYNIRNNKMVHKVFTDPTHDFDGRLRFFGNLFNPTSHTLKGVTQWNDTVYTHWFDHKIAEVQHKYDSILPGSINLIYNADTSLNRFLCRSYSDTKPGDYYLYDKSKDSITLLFKSRPWLKPEMMCRTKSVRFQTRDNLTLHAYLTLPKTGAAPFPTIILIHDDNRVYWGFDKEVQLLASRGYAVFQINYRGSTGFGYTISEREKYNFDKMHNDIVDGTEYVIQNGIADAERIALMGQGFGGYLSILGVALEPNLYRCAISHSGIYDWQKTFRYSGLYYRRFLFDNYEVHLGGGDNSEYLKFISPTYKAKDIKVPVFLALGSNSHRVMTSQAVTLLTKLRHAGVKVEQYFKQYERYNFIHQKNITGYYTRVLDFLARNMKNDK